MQDLLTGDFQSLNTAFQSASQPETSLKEAWSLFRPKSQVHAQAWDTLWRPDGSKSEDYSPLQSSSASISQINSEPPITNQLARP